ncbi:MAG: hypothetical protein WC807_20170 [Hyphomicrobium sp.]
MQDEPKPRRKRQAPWQPPVPPPQPPRRSSSSTFRFAKRHMRGIWNRHREFLGKLGVKAAPPSPTRAQIILSRVEMRETITVILSLVAACSTVALTYNGVADGLAEAGATTKAKIEAVLFSSAIGAMCVLANYHMFGLIDRLRGRYLSTAMLGGVAMLACIAAIDAPFNMRGLAGGSATRMSIEDTAQFYEEQARLIFARVGALQQLLPGLRANAKMYAERQAHEIKTGAESGGRGPGRVESSYGRVAGLLGPLADDLEKDAGKAEALQDAITQLIAEIKRQVYVQGNLRGRVEAAATSADKADVQLGRLARQDLTVSLKATLGSLDGLFPPPVSAPRTALERRQNEAIAQIAAMTRPIAAGLRDALGSLQQAQAAPVKAVRPQNASEAIWTYWRRLIPEWLAAILVTLGGPLCLLLIQIAARREAESLSSNEGEK